MVEGYKDRDGLWRVDKKVFQIFEQVELYFQHNVMGHHQTRIITAKIVAVLQRSVTQKLFNMIVYLF